MFHRVLTFLDWSSESSEIKESRKQVLSKIFIGIAMHSWIKAIKSQYDSGNIGTQIDIF